MARVSAARQNQMLMKVSWAYSRSSCNKLHLATASGNEQMLQFWLSSTQILHVDVYVQQQPCMGVPLLASCLKDRACGNMTCLMLCILHTHL